MYRQSCAIARCTAHSIRFVEPKPTPPNREFLKEPERAPWGRIEKASYAARMVKSADTADLKSADHKRSWGFKSPSGHHYYP
jgi:hypothetical protein